MGRVRECQCSKPVHLTTFAEPREGLSWLMGERNEWKLGPMLSQPQQSVSPAFWCSCPGLGHQAGVCARGVGAGVACVHVIFSHLPLFSPTDPGWGGWASGKGGWICTPES